MIFRNMVYLSFHRTIRYTATCPDAWMSILAEQVPEMEVYSIDEAFLNLEGIRDIQSLGTDIINKDNPAEPAYLVSLGIAQPKHSPKVANKFAKK